MHSLAIALHQKGHTVTGSDDEIFEPARSQLAKLGLLPGPVRLVSGKNRDRSRCSHSGHACTRVTIRNLQKALELGIRVYSYPEFLYHETADKTRVVIAGSHGKTTITVHGDACFTGQRGYKFDYMVGSRLEGFDNMVSLIPDNQIAVFEGDEYLSSCLDPRPKFLLYQPQIALISGIAWDHINVFPTWENYMDQFRAFINNMPADGCLVYCAEDEMLASLADAE